MPATYLRQGERITLPGFSLIFSQAFVMTTVLLYFPNLPSRVPPVPCFFGRAGSLPHKKHSYFVQRLV